MKYKQHTDVILRDGTVGTIVDYDIMDNTYRIKLKGSIAYAWAKEEHLSVPQEPKCQCGVGFVRHGGRHSSWCAAYSPDCA